MSAKLRHLFESERMRARLIHYGARAVFPLHRHDRHFLSIVMLGRMVETIGETCYEAFAPALTVMPAGVEHANVFDDAMLFVVDFDPAAPGVPVAINGDRTIQRLLSAEGLRNVMTAIDSGDEMNEDRLWNLVSLAGDNASHPLRRHPDHLLKARRLIESATAPIDVASVAQDCGVHRVHLNRLFHRYMALRPVEYRIRVMTDRAATGAVHGGLSVTRSAIEAGFSDASHFARELRKRIGVSPRRIRALFDDA